MTVSSVRQKGVLLSCMVVFAIALSGCSTFMPTSQRLRAEELGRQLPDLTTAVRGEIVNTRNGRLLTDAQLLDRLKTERPEFRAFDRANVEVQRGKKNVVLLVGPSDRGCAWLEDSSATPYVDREWYKIDPKHPAVFTLDPAQPPTDEGSSRGR